MPNRKRVIQLNFRVSPEELKIIEEMMKQYGTTNREAMLRKIILEGYVIRFDLPELKEILRLTRYTSNNVNQIARHAHETGRYYIEDIEQMVRNQEAIQDALKEVLNRLAALE